MSPCVMPSMWPCQWSARQRLMPVDQASTVEALILDRRLCSSVPDGYSPQVTLEGSVGSLFPRDLTYPYVDSRHRA
jgi:hypothetical protein